MVRIFLFAGHYSTSRQRAKGLPQAMPPIVTGLASLPHAHTLWRFADAGRAPMTFDSPLLTGTLIKRYKRFLADIRLDDGREVTAHTPNTGSMMGCHAPGSRVWVSDSGNTKRKYPLTWEIIQVDGQTLVGINTVRSNHLVREAIENGVIGELQGYSTILSEVRYGAENSRIDLLLRDHPEEPDCYVEVKNVTLAEGRIALFPDAVSVRGTKHLRELIAMAGEGFRAAICFCIQRQDVSRFRPADRIDPAYGRMLREARQAGVEVLAYRARLDPRAIHLETALPVDLSE